MSNLLVGFVVSFLTCLAILKSDRFHSALSADWNTQGVQKNHTKPVPRVGGLAIFAGLLSSVIMAKFREAEDVVMPGTMLLLSSGVTFLAGLLEDITKKVSPAKRLTAALASGLLGALLLGAWIQRINIPVIDDYLKFYFVGVVFTVFAVAGLSNAVNIIDGFNGLASMVCLMFFLSIAYVAFKFEDVFILAICFAAIGSILGFFIWNFPYGFIFLGDGGAYLLGFVIAELSILLVVRHPEVSVWYPVLMLIYPIFETLFSIYRRRFLKKVPAGFPDGVHLHTLIYRRFLKWAIGSKGSDAIKSRNSMTAPYLWFLSMLAVIPATLFWRNSIVLGIFIIIFVGTYLWLYWRIVRFKSPQWLRHKWLR